MIASVWDDCINHLRGELPDQQFNTWIKPLKLDESEQNGLVLIAPNRFVMDWVNDKFRARIEDLVRQSVNAQFQAGTSKLVLPIELTIVAGNKPAQTPVQRSSVNTRSYSPPPQEQAVPVSTGFQNAVYSESNSAADNSVSSDMAQGNSTATPSHPTASAGIDTILQSPQNDVGGAANNVEHNNTGQNNDLDQPRIITDLTQQSSPRRGTHEAIQLTLDQEVNEAFSGATNEHSHIPSSESIGSSKASVSKADVEGGIQHKSNLNKDFIFKNFVEGKSNQLALAASSQVAENPGGSYNPLFIYGGVGLGKTHLMHAVGNAYLKRSPNAKIVYLHSERFVADMVKALQLNAINDFKRYYRSVNALLIDDIQFFAGKERSQEEFFHTFNALLEGGQQIIVTSDRYPKEITGLEERLKSRFGWGLTVAIEPPELETRVAILMRKADQAKVHLPNDAAFFIAQRIRSNVRELEGALKRVIANAQFTRQPISVELVREALKDLLALQDRLVSIDNIQRIVAEYYKIKISDLHSKRRSRSVARPRQVAMYLAKELTNHSLPEIGESFGGRDHTTVLHACRKIKELITTDADIGEDVKNLLRTLTT